MSEAAQSDNQEKASQEAQQEVSEDEIDLQEEIEEDQTQENPLVDKSGEDDGDSVGSAEQYNRLNGGNLFKDDIGVKQTDHFTSQEANIFEGTFGAKPSETTIQTFQVDQLDSERLEEKMRVFQDDLIEQSSRRMAEIEIELRAQMEEEYARKLEEYLQTSGRSHQPMGIESGQDTPKSYSKSVKSVSQNNLIEDMKKEFELKESTYMEEIDNLREEVDILRGQLSKQSLEMLALKSKLNEQRNIDSSQSKEFKIEENKAFNIDIGPQETEKTENYSSRLLSSILAEKKKTELEEKSQNIIISHSPKKESEVSNIDSHNEDSFRGAALSKVFNPCVRQDKPSEPSPKLRAAIQTAMRVKKKTESSMESGESQSVAVEAISSPSILELILEPLSFDTSKTIKMKELRRLFLETTLRDELFLPHLQGSLLQVSSLVAQNWPGDKEYFEALLKKIQVLWKNMFVILEKKHIFLQDLLTFKDSHSQFFKKLKNELDCLLSKYKSCRVLCDLLRKREVVRVQLSQLALEFGELGQVKSFNRATSSLYVLLKGVNRDLLRVMARGDMGVRYKGFPPGALVEMDFWEEDYLHKVEGRLCTRGRIK